MSQRMTRVLRLLQDFENGDVVDADRLAKKLGVCRRTVYRDIKTLRSSGIALQYDRNAKCYRIHKHVKQQKPVGCYDSSPRPSAITELLLQSAASVLPQSTRQLNLAKEAADALSKRLPLRLRDRYEAMAGSICRAEPHEFYRSQRRKLDVVTKAISEESHIVVRALHQVTGVYDGIWIIWPKQITYNKGLWVLAGTIRPSNRRLKAILSSIDIEPVEDNLGLPTKCGFQEPNNEELVIE